MTADNGRINDRFNNTKDKVLDQLDKYDNEQLLNDISKWIGSWGNSSYDGDMHGIHRSKSKKFDQNALINDMIKFFTDEQTQDMLNWLNGFVGDWTNSDRYWSDTADDEMINNYISDKYSSALDQLDRALKRGLLTETSYNNAINELNNDRSIMESNAQSFGSNQMNTYRDDLENTFNSFSDIVDNYNLGQYGTVNSGFLNNELNKTYNNQMNNFYNDMIANLDQLGGFDVSSIIGDAKVASGIGNQQSNDLINAIEDTNKKKDQQIGLGNQGMF